MTLKQQIEALKALEDKISVGPWGEKSNGDFVNFYGDIVPHYKADADFIALSRNTIFELIDERKEAAELIKCFRSVCDDDMPRSVLIKIENWLSKYNGGE